MFGRDWLGSGRALGRSCPSLARAYRAPPSCEAAGSERRRRRREGTRPWPGRRVPVPVPRCRRVPEPPLVLSAVLLPVQAHIRAVSAGGGYWGRLGGTGRHAGVSWGYWEHWEILGGTVGVLGSAGRHCGYTERYWGVLGSILGCISRHWDHWDPPPPPSTSDWSWLEVTGQVLDPNTSLEFADVPALFGAPPLPSQGLLVGAPHHQTP